VKASEIISLKGKRKLTMLTAYDFCVGGILDECGVDMILVGDSLGMVVLGFEDTKNVTLDDMIRHGKAVVRGCGESLVIVDMPISTYENKDVALENARKIVDEVGDVAVKIEGRADVASFLVREGFDVVGVFMKFWSEKDGNKCCSPEAERRARRVARKLNIPFGVVINREGIGDARVDHYCRQENIPVLMRIPFDREIASVYSRGVPFVERLAEYKKGFRVLLETINSMLGENV